VTRGKDGGTSCLLEEFVRKFARFHCPSLEDRRVGGPNVVEEALLGGAEAVESLALAWGEERDVSEMDERERKRKRNEPSRQSPARKESEGGSKLGSKRQRGIKLTSDRM
jgi:hypothetical protein